MPKTESKKMEKHEIFMAGMGQHLAEELMAGGQIVCGNIPSNDKGFLLIKRAKPKKFPGDEREFWYIMFQKYEGEPRFMESTEFVKINIRQATKKAYAIHFEK